MIDIHKKPWVSKFFDPTYISNKPVMWEYITCIHSYLLIHHQEWELYDQVAMIFINWSSVLFFWLQEEQEFSGNSIVHRINCFYWIQEILTLESTKLDFPSYKKNFVLWYTLVLTLKYITYFVYTAARESVWVF